jgi:erythromycin esterase
MFKTTYSPPEDIIRQVAHPLHTDADLDPLLERIGDSRFVLLGEASHGTSEYYLWRARLSKRLIQEMGFSFIAVEGDWPDCYRVNRYIKGYQDSGASAYEVLKGFERWPSWMWANWEVTALVEWLRSYNKDLPNKEKIGFYGLDVYSLWESLSEVMRYLEENAPESLEAAYRAYKCFQPYGENVQAYAYASQLIPTSCEDDVMKLLLEMQHKSHRAVPESDGEAAFNAEQNAYVAFGAERYYRTMIYGDAESWNIRDRHMAETLNRLVKQFGDTSKAIIWEHNTHIGDARATPMAAAGMLNVGQLVRDDHSSHGVVLVGFGSYQGDVIAGKHWGAPMERLPVPEAIEGSWEAILHKTLGEDYLLIFSDSQEAKSFFKGVHGHRAIGVVYNPAERQGGGFVPSALSRRYDAFIYLEASQALHPLYLESHLDETPETYPWGV